MVLEQIQGQSIGDVAADVATQQLKNAGRPLRLAFRHPSKEEAQIFRFAMQARRADWDELPAGEAADERLVGRRIFHARHGEGTVTNYVTPLLIGGNYHEVLFSGDSPGSEQTHGDSFGVAPVPAAGVPRKMQLSVGTYEERWLLQGRLPVQLTTDYRGRQFVGARPSADLGMDGTGAGGANAVADTSDTFSLADYLNAHSTEPEPEPELQEGLPPRASEGADDDSESEAEGEGVQIRGLRRQLEESRALGRRQQAELAKAEKQVVDTPSKLVVYP
jgi:hypothetical protein